MSEKTLHKLKLSLQYRFVMQKCLWLCTVRPTHPTTTNVATLLYQLLCSKLSNCQQLSKARQLSLHLINVLILFWEQCALFL